MGQPGIAGISSRDSRDLAFVSDEVSQQPLLLSAQIKPAKFLPAGTSAPHGNQLLFVKQGFASKCLILGNPALAVS
jgi:hypothetical protein